MFDSFIKYTKVAGDAAVFQGNTRSVTPCEARGCPATKRKAFSVAVRNVLLPEPFGPANIRSRAISEFTGF